MKIYNVLKLWIMMNNLKIKYLNSIAFKTIFYFNIKMRKDNHKVQKKNPNIMPINLGNYISVCKNEKIFC